MDTKTPSIDTLHHQYEKITEFDHLSNAYHPISVIADLENEQQTLEEDETAHPLEQKIVQRKISTGYELLKAFENDNPISFETVLRYFVLCYDVSLYDAVDGFALSISLPLTKDSRMALLDACESIQEQVGDEYNTVSNTAQFYAKKINTDQNTDITITTRQHMKDLIDICQWGIENTEHDVLLQEIIYEINHNAIQYAPKPTNK